MLGVFVVDATWTLLNRYRLKCHLSDAHRTHAYQYLARHWKSHRNVTLMVLLINVLWLAPIAAMIVGGARWRVGSDYCLLTANLSRILPKCWST